MALRDTVHPEHKKGTTEVVPFPLSLRVNPLSLDTTSFSIFAFLASYSVANLCDAILASVKLPFPDKVSLSVCSVLPSWDK